jgi:Domain of unknown function (DUF5069)
MKQSFLDLVPDLSRVAPRSPRVRLGNYVIAARAVDKCRASLANRAGSYHFNCPIDQAFFRFTKIDASAFQEVVASGASDDDIADWITSHSQVKDPKTIERWNRRFLWNPLPRLLDLDDWIHASRHRKR